MQIRLDLKTGNFLETLFFQTDTGENSASISGHPQLMAMLFPALIFQKFFENNCLLKIDKCMLYPTL